MSWEKLLPAADDASADLSISTITKTSQREKKFAIQFSDSYYCTSYALIYRAGTQEGRSAIWSRARPWASNAETTSADLVDKLARDGHFKIEAFDNTESLQNALVASRIDLGVTDDPVCAIGPTRHALRPTAWIASSSGNSGRTTCHWPQDEQTQQYAIAVHMDEIELLGAINQTLARPSRTANWHACSRPQPRNTRPSNTIRRAAAASGQRPWECFSQTARN